MSNKKVKFVFKSKAKDRVKFPCSVIAHKISVHAANLVFEEKIKINHPYAVLSMVSNDLRHKQREKRTDVAEVVYDDGFEQLCRSFLKDNLSKIQSFHDLDGVSDILAEIGKVGLVQDNKQEVSKEAAPAHANV